MWDVVWVGTFLGTIAAGFGAIVYLYAIVTRQNGSYADAYVCALFTAFACNYGYLNYARGMMYEDYTKFIYLISRKDYFPLVYFVVAVIIAMTIHKIHDILERRK